MHILFVDSRSVCPSLPHCVDVQRSRRLPTNQPVLEFRRASWVCLETRPVSLWRPQMIIPFIICGLACIPILDTHLPKWCFSRAYAGTNSHPKRSSRRLLDRPRVFGRVDFGTAELGFLESFLSAGIDRFVGVSSLLHLCRLLNAIVSRVVEAGLGSGRKGSDPNVCGPCKPAYRPVGAGEFCACAERPEWMLR